MPDPISPCLLPATSALLAYVGPGAGINLVGALVAVFAALLFAIAGVLFWPLRALLRRYRRRVAATPPEGDGGSVGPDSPS